MANPSQTYEIRPYRPGDERKILELHRAVYRQTQSVEHWTWLFKSNPVGHAWIWLAWAGSELVGHYAVIPERIWIDGSEVLGAQSLDTMTHPNYLRRGIFVRLARQTFAQADGDGSTVMYGLPNEMSRPGFLTKLGWQEVFTLNRFVKPLRPSERSGRRVRYALTSLTRWRGDAFLRRLSRRRASWTVEEVTDFPPDFDELARASAERARLSIYHGAAYVQWRFLACPDATYHVFIARKADAAAGCASIRILDQEGRRIGLVSHVDGHPRYPEAIGRLLAKIQEFCASRDADSIAFIGNRSDLVARTLARAGYIRRPSDLGIIVRTGPSFSSATDPYSQNGWSMDVGDTDYV